MKQIIALIRPNMIDDVISALHQVEDFPGATMSEVKGIARGIHQHNNENCEKPAFVHPEYIRLEITCPDNLTDNLVNTVTQNAHTGRHGDGNITVLAVDSKVII